jgi:hypothetical protein
MSPFAPVSDDELARARNDPAFRQRLLSDNMEALLAGLQRLRKAPVSDRAGAEQIREGVELAVRLAELIQEPVKEPVKAAATPDPPAGPK